LEESGHASQTMLKKYKYRDTHTHLLDHLPLPIWLEIQIYFHSTAPYVIKSSPVAELGIAIPIWNGGGGGGMVSNLLDI